MKTGKPTRLSEKLNAELDTIRQDYAASMASQLESFRTDLNSIATNAQRTIEIDTRTFLRQNKSWLTISPWLITGTFLVGIVSMMAASLLWTLMLASSETDGLGPDADRQGGRDLAGAGPDQDAPEDLHTGRQVSDLHQDRGELDDDTPDSLGTRLARLRRAVGDGLRGLSKGIERVRGTLDDQDAEPDGWIGRLRVSAHSIASGVRGCVARLVERGLELREAAHATRDELEISESRRREAETELEAREVEMDRGLTH